MKKAVKWVKRALTRRNLIILAVVLGAIGFGFWTFRPKAPAPETTYTVTKGDITEVVLASGEITASRAVSLNFPTTGKLAYVNVKVGDVVDKYESLAGMDTADLDALVTSSYYRYLAADAEAKLIEDQVKDHSTDESFSQKAARVAVQTSRDIAYDTWLAAKRDLADSRLVAPFAGVITQSTVSAPGDRIGAADLISLVDPTSMYFEAEVDETDINKIKVGQLVELSFDAFASTTSGKVNQIGFVSRLSDSGSNIYPVRISVLVADLPEFRIGFNGDARISIAQTQNTLKLPLEAVADNEVTLVDGTKKTVETGLVGETEIEIKSGLNEGDIVLPSF